MNEAIDFDKLSRGRPGETVDFDKIPRGRPVMHPPKPERQDFAAVAISQELLAANDRSIGLRIELLKRDAQIAELLREIAELRKGDG